MNDPATKLPQFFNNNRLKGAYQLPVFLVQYQSTTLADMQ